MGEVAREEGKWVLLVTGGSHRDGAPRISWVLTETGGPPGEAGSLQRRGGPQEELRKEGWNERG